MTANPLRRRWSRRIAALVIAVAAGVGLGFGTYATSLQPGAAIVKAAFESNPLVTVPSDFPAIAARVEPVARTPIDVADAPTAYLDIYRPVDDPAGSPAPIVLWVHGGGFISSSSQTVADYAIMLAGQGFVVASLDYTLAPTAHHPVPVLQATAALDYLHANAASIGGDADRIVIGGDSAGAQIASETAAVTPSSVRGVVLFCGLYDMTTVGDSGFPGLRTYLWAYTGQRDWENYTDLGDMSTTTRAGADYPPTFLSVGDVDPFANQAYDLAAALTARGVDVTTLFWTDSGDGLSHEYQFDFTLPQAQTAFDDTTTFVKKVTAP